MESCIFEAKVSVSGTIQVPDYYGRLFGEKVEVVLFRRADAEENRAVSFRQIPTYVCGGLKNKEPKNKANGKSK